MKKGDTVDALMRQIDLARLPAPELEYLFSPVADGKPVRRWRFDCAWPDRLLALEIDGGLFGGGRHGGQRSVVRDVEKRAVAACLGWRIVPVTPSQVRSGQAVVLLRAALAGGALPL